MSKSSPDVMESQAFLAAVLLGIVLAICSCSQPENSPPPTYLPPVYLDPHLHSERSSDWGSHGLSSVLGNLASIQVYAALNGVNEVWLTDHAEDNPQPFTSTASVRDALEICTPVVFLCYNQTFINGRPYILYVNTHVGVLDMPVGWAQGVEILSTGGDPSLPEERVALDKAIELIQLGHKLAFFGTSNNHAGLAGANGVTAVDRFGTESLDQAVLAGRTTAMREKQHTMFLRSKGNGKATMAYPQTIEYNYCFVKVEVYGDEVIETVLHNETELQIDPKAAATFVKLLVGNKLAAATSPIYAN